jgi:hypothetical protein
VTEDPYKKGELVKDGTLEYVYQENNERDHHDFYDNEEQRVTWVS